MMKRISLLAGVLALALSLTAANTSFADGPVGPPTAYYLSLGDSLAQGVQPDATGHGVPTNQGYVDDLYAAAHARIPNLQLVKLGCPGESTTSMISGTVCLTYPEGSQLKAAVAFLRAHRQFVLFVTIDIGSNDIEPCLISGAIDETCVRAAFASTQKNLPFILRALREAASPRTRIAGMTYYDPLLAAWLQGSSGQLLARQSVEIGTRFNALLSSIYSAAGSPVADVQGAFSTTDFVTTVSLPGVGQVPLNVARICQ